MNEVVVVLSKFGMFVGVSLMAATFIEMAIERHIEKKAIERRKKIVMQRMTIWKIIAQETDPIENAEDRGYAVARVLSLQYELNALEGGKQNADE